MGRFPDGSSDIHDIYTLARPTPGTNNVANTPPALDPIADASLFAGETLSFYASASDSDQPPQTLTFSLGFGAPADASIDPFSGLFTWRPDAAGDYVLTVVVTDDGTPSQSASRNFGVTVYPQPSLAGMGLTGNQFTFGWSTLSGKTYQVEYRNSLLPGPWAPYGDPVLGTGGVLTVTVDVTTAPRRYYRVKIMQ